MQFLTLKRSALRFKKIGWLWKCPSCRSVNQLFRSPERHDETRCANCGNHFKITGGSPPVTRGRGQTWTEEERTAFINRYRTTPNSKLAEDFGVSISDIFNQRQHVLRTFANTPALKLEAVALKLTKDEDVKKAALKASLARWNARRTDQWPPVAEHYLRDNYGRLTLNQLAKDLYTTRDAVASKLTRMGLMGTKTKNKDNKK